MLTCSLTGKLLNLSYGLRISVDKSDNLEGKKTVQHK